MRIFCPSVCYSSGLILFDSFLSRNRICSAVTTCNLQAQVEYYPPTVTSNRVCVNLRACTGDIFNSEDASCTSLSGSVTNGINTNSMNMPLTSIGGQLGVNNQNLYAMNFPILTAIGGPVGISSTQLTRIFLPALRTAGN